MRRVLLTNYSYKGFSGSELDTLNIAEWFINKNYEVDIFCFEYGNELSKITDNRIRIIRYHDNSLLFSKYDIIWAHHFPLLYLVLFIRNVEAKYIHYVSLSSVVFIEDLPNYYKELTKVSVLSEEAKIRFITDGYDGKYINIFNNCVTNDFFVSKEKLSKKINKICFVSNHAPDEILQLQKLFLKDGLVFDIFGIGFKYEIITSNLLKEYDVVISIGRTVNYSLSLGIPCYVYDHFGGDGYLTSNNIKDSFDYNFTGRFSRIKKTSIELYEDILNNYSICVKEQKYCRKFAKNNFDLDYKLNSFLKEIVDKPEVNICNIKENYKNIIKKNNTLIEFMDKYYLSINKDL